MSRARGYQYWESDPDYPKKRDNNRGAGHYMKSCGSFKKKEGKQNDNK